MRARSRGAVDLPGTASIAATGLGGYGIARGAGGGGGVPGRGRVRDRAHRRERAQLAARRRPRLREPPAGPDVRAPPTRRVACRRRRRSHRRAAIGPPRRCAVMTISHQSTLRILTAGSRPAGAPVRAAAHSSTVDRTSPLRHARARDVGEAPADLVALSGLCAGVLASIDMTRSSSWPGTSAMRTRRRDRLALHLALGDLARRIASKRQSARHELVEQQPSE